MNFEELSLEQLKQIIKILRESNEQLYGICGAYIREDIVEKMKQAQDLKIQVVVGVN